LRVEGFLAERAARARVGLRDEVMATLTDERWEPHLFLAAVLAAIALAALALWAIGL
jgi:hypothetical protein